MSGPARRGALHLVPVPIAAPPLPGEEAAGTDEALRHLAPGAVEQARQARYFLVENARSARAFLKRIAHPQAIASLRIVEIGHHPDEGKLDEWLAPLAGTEAAPACDAVVLSEAGCPGIADPGASLVARAHALGLAVVPWSGPSAILLALMGAGMNGQQFRFHGYLPQERDALRRRLRELQAAALAGETQVFIETPYRNARLFEAICEDAPAALRLCVAVDLTAPGAFLRSLPVGAWRALPPGQRPDLERRPAVFLLCV